MFDRHCADPSAPTEGEILEIVARVEAFAESAHADLAPAIGVIRAGLRMGGDAMKPEVLACVTFLVLGYQAGLADRDDD